jgi:3-oxoadipate enol-lactonase
MTDSARHLAPVIDTGEWPHFHVCEIRGPSGKLYVRLGGPEDGPAVLFSHSILTSSAVWRRQATLLAHRGFRTLCLDTRGHGASEAPPSPYTVDELVDDSIAVLDGLDIERAHFVGVSLGGMVGFGCAARYPRRIASLCVTAARADAPPVFAFPWNERVALVVKDGSVDRLAYPTALRWFGALFLEWNPGIANDLHDCIRATSPEGFIGCARAIQGLNYLSAMPNIAVPTTLIVGEHDELLLQPMRELAPVLGNAVLHVIAKAGHLPQVDQPQAFDALLLRHLDGATECYRTTDEAKI